MVFAIWHMVIQEQCRKKVIDAREAAIMKRIQRLRMNDCFCTIHAWNKKADRQNAQIRHLHQTHLITGLLIGAVLLSQALFPVRAHADDSGGGHIVVLRTIPAHDAFRIGDIGTPTDVSTAPEMLSDAVMGNVNGQSQPANGVTAANSAMTGSLATTLGNSSSTIDNTVTQVLVGGGGATGGLAGAIMRGMAPLGSLANIMPGAR
jgi:hypothetical protein